MIAKLSENPIYICRIRPCGYSWGFYLDTERDMDIFMNMDNRDNTEEKGKDISITDGKVISINEKFKYAI